METYLGPFVLGGLELDEDETVRRHLEGCAECQDVLSELAWIPAWLHKVPADEFERLITDDTEDAEYTERAENAGTSVQAVRSAPRRRTHWQTLAALAAAVAIGAVGVTAVLTHDTEPVVATSTLQSVDGHTRVAATLTMTPQGATTALRLNLTGVPAGEHCSLIVHTADGRSTITASWRATYRGTADIPATADVPADRLRGFDVVTADGQVLVRLAVPPNR